MAKGGVEVVAVNDPFLDVDYMVSWWYMYHHYSTCRYVCMYMYVCLYVVRKQWAQVLYTFIMYIHSNTCPNIHTYLDYIGGQVCMEVKDIRVYLVQKSYIF